MNPVSDQLSALAHPQRLSLFKVLMRHFPEARTAGQLAALLKVPASTLSGYLAALTAADLIHAVRQGTTLHYRCRPETARTLMSVLLDDCCLGLATPRTPEAPASGIWNVLFLSAHNGMRGLIAESLLRHQAGDRYEAFSAACLAPGPPDQAALTLLAAEGHDISPLWSKAVAGFCAEDAPQMDYIITLTDRAAVSAPLVWQGRPLHVHWPLPSDPAQAYTALGPLIAALRALDPALPYALRQQALAQAAGKVPRP